MMADDMWLPGVERIPGNSGGTMTGDGSRKLLLHSTEGTTIEGAVGAYRGGNSWPTLTVDCPDRRVVQHLALDDAARALRNEAGGGQTNREGTILVQIELVGFAGTPASIGMPSDLDWFGRTVVAPIAAATGVPLTVGVVFARYPGSYGRNAPQRLTTAEWDAYSGVLGHMHAPENSHGDPGVLDVDRILTAARVALGDPAIPTTVQEDDDMLRVLGVRNDPRRPFMALDKGAVIKFTDNQSLVDTAKQEVWAPAKEYTTGVGGKQLHPVEYVDPGVYDDNASLAKRRV